MNSLLTRCKVSNIIIIALLLGSVTAFPQAKKINKLEAPKPSFVLMCLSAHPDDEDGATLACYGKLENVKTYSVFYTRGEGGQNETGSELYEDLGAIRTKETLEAAKILGTEVLFLGFPDFGFSKTAKETFSKWGGKDSVLAKTVYAIRCIKPDVIITNHDTVTTIPRRQHGNHQVVGITAYEAFVKAADPKFHPEQFKNDIVPWKVKKLFFRNFSTSDTTRDSLVTIDMEKKFLSSISIADIAITALQQHASQGLARLTLDSVSEDFLRRRYRLMRSDGEYFYDPTDLFSDLTSTARPILMPEDQVVTLQPRFSLHVSPSASSLGIKAISSTKRSIVRSFALTLLNSTGKPLKSEVLAYAGSVRIFQKGYEIDGGVNARMVDTISLHLEDISSMQHSIRFVATAKSINGRPSDIIRAGAEIELKSPPGTYNPNAYVGLVRTYDNTLEETMRSYDIHYSLIDSAMLASGNLDQFSVIILDLRAYEFRADAVLYASKLLEYARSGGNLVVFYHKPRDWNGKKFAPYPLQLTSERVTQENAPVTSLLSQHILLTTPNKIAQNDWSGWLQERSIYLPSDDTTHTSSHYERILSMSDEGERQPSTSLLWTRYEKGSYTYISLALYRQLRILQDGAVKLFFNLISQSNNR